MRSKIIPTGIWWMWTTQQLSQESDNLAQNADASSQRRRWLVSGQPNPWTASDSMWQRRTKIHIKSNLEMVCHKFGIKRIESTEPDGCCHWSLASPLLKAIRLTELVIQMSEDPSVPESLVWHLHQEDWQTWSSLPGGKFLEKRTSLPLWMLCQLVGRCFVSLFDETFGPAGARGHHQGQKCVWTYSLVRWASTVEQGDNMWSCGTCQNWQSLQAVSLSPCHSCCQWSLFWKKILIAQNVSCIWSVTCSGRRIRQSEKSHPKLLSLIC